MTKADDGLARLRAWWFWRQGLSPRNEPASVVECLRQAGWLATAGSTGVYLSMRARLPGMPREAIDRAAIDGVEVVEVPGAHARPPVLVPRDEMALALRLHWASYAKHAAPLYHAIVAGGELVGVWEYDPGANTVVTRLWRTDKALRARVADSAAKTEHFIRQQLGDAKLSAVDPPARRAKRIAFCGK